MDRLGDHLGMAQQNPRGRPRHQRECAVAMTRCRRGVSFEACKGRGLDSVRRLRGHLCIAHELYGIGDRQVRFVLVVVWGIGGMLKGDEMQCIVVDPYTVCGVFGAHPLGQFVCRFDQKKLAIFIFDAHAQAWHGLS